MKEPAPSVQPVYAWWPWRAVALAVPVAAALSGYAVVATESQVPDLSRAQLVALTSFTVYGAGNGFLLGAAIGDFGRSILAMVMGALAALLLLPLYDGVGLVLGPPFITLVMMATLALHWNMSGIMDAVWTGFGSLFLAALAGALALVVSALGVLIVEGLFRFKAGPVLAMVIALMVANAVFIGRIFRASYRVQGSDEAR
ncbi:MAG: hypothetical protein HY291_24195 [Planctomycetes bacterium]|nr:hypothetical protein [Planctomycetota bacterium]